MADLPRMGEWSPECQRVEWEGGASGPAAGATFVGHNRGGPRGLMKWSRRGRVLVADPAASSPSSPRRAAASRPSGATASRPLDGGTRVTESYEVKWIPAWARIVDVPTNRARELREAMEHTLARLKAAAEARDEAGRP